MSFVIAAEAWLMLGVVLVLLELLVPGLISVFVGFGALTVSAGIYWGSLNSLPLQLLTWFISSLIYIFTLRLLVMKYFPQDTNRAEVDDDAMVMGSIVEVAEDIVPEGEGRIYFSDSTWRARSATKNTLVKGQKCRIVGRDNIVYLVGEIQKEEENLEKKEV